MQYYATGISVVVHPRNPMVPVRTPTIAISRSKTRLPAAPVMVVPEAVPISPYYLFDEDASHFHRTYKAASTRWMSHIRLPQADAWSTSGFLIAAEQERRRNLLRSNARSALPGSRVCPSCMAAFVAAYLPIVRRRGTMPYEPAHRDWQQLRHGRYAEFNLVATAAQHSACAWRPAEKHPHVLTAQRPGRNAETPAHLAAMSTA